MTTLSAPAEKSTAVLRLGTRASVLARTQSQTVADAITAATGTPVELVHITTEGDRSQAAIAQLGGGNIGLGFAIPMDEAIAVAEQIIRTGRGMARAVESETPGIFHRHALNYLISTRNWSPPSRPTRTARSRSMPAR